MDEVDFVLPFNVRAVGNDTLHLEFELDDASAARFGSVVERLSVRRVA